MSPFAHFVSVSRQIWAASRYSYAGLFGTSSWEKLSATANKRTVQELYACELFQQLLSEKSFSAVLEHSQDEPASVIDALLLSNVLHDPRCLECSRDGLLAVATPQFSKLLGIGRTCRWLVGQKSSAKKNNVASVNEMEEIDGGACVEVELFGGVIVVFVAVGVGEGELD